MYIRDAPSKGSLELSEVACNKITFCNNNNYVVVALLFLPLAWIPPPLPPTFALALDCTVALRVRSITSRWLPFRRALLD